MVMPRKSNSFTGSCDSRAKRGIFSGRKEFLRRAAKVPGMYVPAFYEVSYHEDGTIRSFLPTEDGIPEKITKEIQMDVTDTYYPMKPIVPFIKVTQDRVVLEIQRGCIRGCRFCQAGFCYRPVRSKSADALYAQAVSRRADAAFLLRGRTSGRFCAPWWSFR